MKEYVSIGKNVNIAIEDGLRTLGLQREDVDIKILETGGLFKKAKVCLMYEEKQPEVVETPVEENNEVVETVEETPVEEVTEEAKEEVTEEQTTTEE